MDGDGSFGGGSGSVRLEGVGFRLDGPLFWFWCFLFGALGLFFFFWGGASDLVVCFGSGLLLGLVWGRSDLFKEKIIYQEF